MNRRVLITGTTSGLGRALLELYHRRGDEVIAVNRRPTPEQQAQFPGIRAVLVDIRDEGAVHACLAELGQAGLVPDLLVLNAGINRPDNLHGLDYDAFKEVMEINLNGVLTFVAAVRALGWEGKTIACISSTSNFVPNPAHIAYAVSKRALFESFAYLSRRDPRNRYKTVVLGPVHTNIARGYPRPKGLQGKIFDALAIPAARAAEKCAAFFEGRKRVLYYTKTAVAFYLFTKAVEEAVKITLFIARDIAGTR